MTTAKDTSATLMCEWADMLSAALELSRIDTDHLDTLLPREPADEQGKAGDALSVPRLAAMLQALGLDPSRVGETYPELLRRSQEHCRACKEKARCDREVSAGTAEGAYEEFCPNAGRIHALLATMAADHT